MFSKSSDEEHNFWMSYTDLVTGFMIIFIVITLFLFNKKSENEDYKERFLKCQEQSNKDTIQEADIVKAKYQELTDKFKEKFKNKDWVEFTDDATLRFVLNDKGEKWFVDGNYKLTNYFNNVLDDFVPLYYDVIHDLYIAQDSFKIKELRVEGHTNSTGNYYNNLSLSSGRAIKIQGKVLKNKYFRKFPKDFQDFVKSNTVAVGYSFSRLLDTSGAVIQLGDTSKKEDKNRSKRVEFRLLLEYNKKK